MSRIAEYLAAQSLRIQAQRAALAADPEPIQDADPVPAKLIAEGVPVFKTRRDGRASVHVPYLESIAMTIAKGDRAKAATLLRAAAEHVETARAASIWPADLGALDHG